MMPKGTLTRPLASICSAAYTKPPHLGQPCPSGAFAIAFGSNTALLTAPLQIKTKVFKQNSGSGTNILK